MGAPDRSRHRERRATGCAQMQQEIKAAVHQELIKRLDLDKIALMHGNPASQQQLLTVIHQLIGEQGIPLSAAERDRLAQEVLDEVFGLGPLEPLLQDATVNDILVNTFNSIYVERAACWRRPPWSSRTTGT